MSPKKNVEVILNGRVFRLRCPESEERRLREAAELVEDKISELNQTGAIVDSTRVSLLAALNIAYDLLEREANGFRQTTEYERIKKRLKWLAEEIETNLTE